MNVFKDKKDELLLTDEEIAKAKNPILQEDWADFGQYVRGVTEEDRLIAEAQLAKADRLGCLVGGLKLLQNRFDK